MDTQNAWMFTEQKDNQFQAYYIQLTDDIFQSSAVICITGMFWSWTGPKMRFVFISANANPTVWCKVSIKSVAR